MCIRDSPTPHITLRHPLPARLLPLFNRLFSLNFPIPFLRPRRSLERFKDSLLGCVEGGSVKEVVRVVGEGCTGV